MRKKGATNEVSLDGIRRLSERVKITCSNHIKTNVIQYNFGHLLVVKDVEVETQKIG